MSGFDKPNLLPYDGIVNYFGRFVDHKIADEYFQKLMATILWQQDEVVIYGKRYVTRRKTGWYGDEDYDYAYSGMTRRAKPWTPELLGLKKIAEQRTGEHYNSCLLNLYHDGSDGMSWHSDNEKMLKENGAIASMSFGANRKFSFKHNTTKETVSLMLEHGSLLVMRGEIQSHWKHALPKSVKVKDPRINLTFRTIVA